MIAVVQRVSSARVEAPEVDHRASIARGLCVLLGVEHGDTPAQADWIADKLARLRVFPDPADETDEGRSRMNRSVLDVRGEILLISQFTLLGDASRGHRPSFTRAAPPDLAEPLYLHVAERLRTHHRLPVATGAFGTTMHLTLTNQGPVTIVLERRA